tara:strand:+ start:2318 stop:2671 length:354 start_codon:yes stop_codon:yes gene_type:complete
MSNLSDLLPAGAGGKQVNFVATGTIGNGVTVALNSDGTVTAVGGGNLSSFIGISDAAISSGASGSVTIKGGISSNVTSLTPNSNYYVQTNGTLSTTTSTELAGRALSSTSINLDYTT